MVEPSGVEALDNALWRVPLRTPTLPPATRTNTYLLGSASLCVVDPAPVDEAEQDELVRQVHAIAKRGGTAVALVLTHHHRDHVSAALRLREELKLPVLAHRATAERVEVTVDRELREGDTLPSDGPAWRAWHTPGHAVGHLCFLRDSDRMLVAGDMVAGVGTILVDPDEGSMADYMASLRRLKGLDPVALLPAHGPVMSPGVDHLQRYLDHRQARLDAVLQRVRAGDAEPGEMVPHIYAGTPPSFFPLAERSVLAMLLMLAQQELVFSASGRWIAR